MVPCSYLVFWAVLLGFSLYSEPVVCGMGLVIMLTGVPIYFIGVQWKNKPYWVYSAVGEQDQPKLLCIVLLALCNEKPSDICKCACVSEKVTYLGQKLCYVVFPQDDPSEIQPLTEKSEL